MKYFVNEQDIVIPGQIIAEGENINLSGSVYKNGNKAIANNVGIVQKATENKIRVKPLKGKYFPNVKDIVIGLVEETNLTSWKVDIGGPYPAILLVSNATNDQFDPINDDARKYFDVGDAIRAEIRTFDRTRDPQLSTTTGKGLGKLVGGRIIEINPSLISRVIGRNGSMISKIKEFTGCKIIVGHNGRVWIRGENVDKELKVIEAIDKIIQESHVTGLTERVIQFLKEK